MMGRTVKRTGVGKVVGGLLVGSVVGATVGWLTAPASGESIRRQLKSDRVSAREKAKSATGNLESKFRDLAEEASEPVARSATRKS
jgi:gas vesicle protein